MYYIRVPYFRKPPHGPGTASCTKDGRDPAVEGIPEARNRKARKPERPEARKQKIKRSYTKDTNPKLVIRTPLDCIFCILSASLKLLFCTRPSPCAPLGGPANLGRYCSETSAQKLAETGRLLARCSAISLQTSPPLPFEEDQGVAYEVGEDLRAILSWSCLHTPGNSPMSLALARWHIAGNQTMVFYMFSVRKEETARSHLVCHLSFWVSTPCLRCVTKEQE